MKYTFACLFKGKDQEIRLDLTISEMKIYVSIPAEKGSPEESASLDFMEEFIRDLKSLDFPMATFSRNMPSGPDRVDRICIEIDKTIDAE